MADTERLESPTPKGGLLRRLALRERAKDLYLRLRMEHASPRQVAEAVALGGFIGCSPFFGFHGWIALGAATLLRRNRLFCFAGSRVCMFFIYPWIVFAEIQLVHRLRTGAFVPATTDTILATAPHLLLDWVVGWFLIGLPLAGVLGVLSYLWARRRDRSQAEKEAAIPRSTPQSRPPSLEPPASSSVDLPP